VSDPRAGFVPPESLEEAAGRLEEIAPGYLERVRGLAVAMGVAPTPAARARRAVDRVVGAARIDPGPPLRSRRRSRKAARRVIGSLMRFYIGFVTEQVTDLGESASWMGTALCDYVDGLEAEVAALRDRVRCLEEGQAHP
jgi:hypothetical protein